MISIIAEHIINTTSYQDTAKAYNHTSTIVTTSCQRLDILPKAQYHAHTTSSPKTQHHAKDSISCPRHNIMPTQHHTKDTTSCPRHNILSKMQYYAKDTISYQRHNIMPTQHTKDNITPNDTISCPRHNIMPKDPTSKDSFPRYTALCLTWWLLNFGNSSPKL